MLHYLVHRYTTPIDNSETLAKISPMGYHGRIGPFGEVNLQPFDLVAELRHGRILLLGEGNMTFARALGRKKRMDCRLLTVTTFEAESAWTLQTSAIASALRAKGATVIGAVDARHLPQVFGEDRFTVILWNSPLAPAPPRQRGQLTRVNKTLMADFLPTALAQLEPRGKMVLTLHERYYQAWAVCASAQCAGFVSIAREPYSLNGFHG